jgi:pimeloyl-ACP methyl ester carboxylesterase
MRQLGDRPLVVLTAGREQPQADLDAMGITREQGIRVREAVRTLHDDETSWSRYGRHEFVPDASHYLQFDRPDVVIRAVREVADAVRTAGV